MEQIVPAFDQLSTACVRYGSEPSNIYACVCSPVYARTVYARYEALFSAIAMADPTHRRKVQLESATRPEIIGEHSRENVTHQSVASLPSSVPFLRHSSSSLCHVTIRIFLSLELLLVMLRCAHH